MQRPIGVAALDEHAIGAAHCLQQGIGVGSFP
jgi:hypothetical protein